MDNYAALAQKYRRGVGAEVPAGFAQAPAEEIAARLNADRRYVAYLGRFIQIIMGDGRLPEVAMALFDRDGYLLRLFGPEEALTRMGDDGIREGNIWTLEAAGCSAVTVGLLEKKPLCSIGAENEHRALRKYGWYFVPIQMNEYGDRTKQLNFGGVALCVPAEAQRRGYAALVHAIAYETVMNMHFGQTANALFEVSGKSALNYDLRMLNGEATVAYCSPSLFPLLDIPYQDLYFRPMAELIDPLPDNEKFWRIVKEMQVVNDYELTVQIHGQKRQCILSSTCYDQPDLEVSGGTLFFTTRKEVVTRISSKIGSAAVLRFDDIIGASPEMANAKRLAQRVADTDSNVMIVGESGTGKDVFAQAIHNASARRDKPFVAVNCAALPRELIISELFGYDSGAFTGAKKSGSIGKFELAGGGTLFLDEIGDMPLDIQATLLRAVEKKQFMRLGSNKIVDVDVRIISATNADMNSRLAQKQFRTDLYYRLSMIQLALPPLRRRGYDIVLLAEHFIKSICQRLGRTTQSVLTPDAKQQLLSMPWRGNARELQNIMERVVQFCTGSVITAQDILDCSADCEVPGDGSARELGVPEHACRCGWPRCDVTAEELREALQACGGNKRAAAEYLSISRRTLYRYLERYDIGKFDNKFT